MRIDWWTLALQAINVLVLVWLLARFLYRPIMAAIAARQAMANKMLADAQAAESLATERAAALDRQAQAIVDETDKRRAEMRARVEAERAQLFDQARAQADDLAKQSAASVLAEQTRREKELEDKAGVLAGVIAAKLLARLPAGEITDAMFGVLLERIAALPDERRDLLAREAPLVIATPAAITADAQERFARKLADALPGVVRPDFTIDPAMIGGFELRSPHLQVRNSWRADLDEILTALREDRHARFG